MLKGIFFFSSNEMLCSPPRPVNNCLIQIPNAVEQWNIVLFNHLMIYLCRVVATKF